MTYSNGPAEPELLSEVEYLRFRLPTQNVLGGLWDTHSRMALAGVSCESWNTLAEKAIYRMIATP